MSECVSVYVYPVSVSLSVCISMFASPLYVCLHVYIHLGSDVILPESSGSDPNAAVEQARGGSSRPFWVAQGSAFPSASQSGRPAGIWRRRRVPRPSVSLVSPTRSLAGTHPVGRGTSSSSRSVECSLLVPASTGVGRSAAAVSVVGSSADACESATSIVGCGSTRTDGKSTATVRLGRTGGTISVWMGQSACTGRAVPVWMGRSTNSAAGPRMGPTRSARGGSFERLVWSVGIRQCPECSSSVVDDGRRSVTDDGDGARRCL